MPEAGIRKGTFNQTPRMIFFYVLVSWRVRVPKGPVVMSPDFLPASALQSRTGQPASQAGPGKQVLGAVV